MNNLNNDDSKNINDSPIIVHLFSYRFVFSPPVSQGDIFIQLIVGYKVKCDKDEHKNSGRSC
jgi:hypothetical protein